MYWHHSEYTSLSATHASILTNPLQLFHNLSSNFASEMSFPHISKKKASCTMTTHVYILALPAAHHHLRKSHQTDQHTTLALLFNNAMHHGNRNTLQNSNIFPRHKSAPCCSAPQLTYSPAKVAPANYLRVIGGLFRLNMSQTSPRSSKRPSWFYAASTRCPTTRGTTRR